MVVVYYSCVCVVCCLSCSGFLFLWFDVFVCLGFLFGCWLGVLVGILVFGLVCRCFVFGVGFVFCVFGLVSCCFCWGRFIVCSDFIFLSFVVFYVCVLLCFWLLCFFFFFFSVVWWCVLSLVGCVCVVFCVCGFR